MSAQESTDSAAYAVALNELGQLKLSEGKTEEAQDLFRKALDVQQRLGEGASQSEQHSAAEEDDWESRWDKGTVSLERAASPASSGEQVHTQAKSTEVRTLPSGTASRAASRSKDVAASSTASRKPASTAASVTAAAASPSGRQQGAEEGGEMPFGGAHILEVYDLTPAVKTGSLEQFLACLQPNAEVPAVVKWIDDYRALALFANPRAAQRALQAVGSLKEAAGQLVYSLRAFADASPLSRAMPASELQAPKPRPLTTATVARRLIGGALNMQLRDKDEERVLAAARQQLKVAQVQRREKLDEAWGDD